ncbi:MULTISPECIES: TRAP transporter substrate-binding protein [Brevibacillus]|jgi:C4-dicarboxylate-binding protein DctP|uniref:TRAP transporter substrate-binding protein n=1 Tax=Brevibacillus TaxID=55080 RepID=UPI00057C04C8|nr:TRAP transporter substrate-binding protein [Brevibacillus borstelensis]RNB60626.1 DctP family TRAP transporter solute-binding subunit [Brevibacillus borstelensis]WNF04613.1 TRAP transporter substrate-binding protein [Brevibacillus borstelensis]GED51952.1 C4-dicarboxylate-binding protein DctB [Brevibacillus borstelensis]
MKSFLSITLVVVLGFLSAILIGFRTDLPFSPLAYDEEQEGLQDRLIIKFSHVVAENTPKGLAVERFSQLVKEKSNGRIEVQVFPNGILYSDITEYDALRNGDIQMIAPAFSNLADKIPEWSVLDLPFAFRDETDVEEAFNGEIGRLLFESLEPFDMKGMAFWNNGFKQMTSNRPIRRPEDFKGQRFRIIQSKVLEAQFQALGAKGYGAPFTDVYQKLASGQVDGQENTISNIYTRRLYQVQRYMTLSNHGYLGYAVIMNKQFWEDLPPETQTIIQEALKETTAYSNQQALAINEQQWNQLQKMPLEIHKLTAEETEVWQAAMKSVYDAFAPVIGPAIMKELEELHAKPKRRRIARKEGKRFPEVIPNLWNQESKALSLSQSELLLASSKTVGSRILLRNCG